MKAKRLTGNEDSAIDPDMARPKKDLPEHIPGRYPTGSRERLQRMQRPGVSQNDILVAALDMFYTMWMQEQRRNRPYRVNRDRLFKVRFRR